MDRVILADKLESLRRCVVRIEERRVASADALEADVDAQDIVTLNLTRAIQLCVDAAAHVLADTEQPTPATMGEAFDLLAAEGLIPSILAARMRAAVGFRNIAVHAYQRIDWAIVHRLTYDGLDDLRTFATRLARLLA
ncbi:MAG: DUF86 domain-containing protein [Trueperaceae bacterium]|nr:DUF86 domain-containing protein [Trueperaceae bacterium]